MNRISRCFIIFGLTFGSVIQTFADVLAVTHADFSTAAQGTAGFQYGYYDDADSTTAPFTTGTSGAGPMQAGTDGIGPFWQANAEGTGTPILRWFEQHPGAGPSLRPVVRRYVVGAPGEPSYTGPVRIVGKFLDFNGGATNVFVALDPDGDEGPEPRTLILPSTPLAGPVPVVFDLAVTVSPGTTIDFGVLAMGSYNSDSTGLAAWIVTDAAPLPTNVVANSYHPNNFSTGSGSFDSRGLAFTLATNGVIGGTDATTFHTGTGTGFPYQFAGLLYLEEPESTQATRFDIVRVNVTTAGDFTDEPRLYLLRHNSDPNTSNPAADDRYVRLPVRPIKQDIGGQPAYDFYLYSDLPEAQRSGYGIAIVGAVGPSTRLVVSEIHVESSAVSNAGITAPQPFFVGGPGGHRYAFSIARGDWEQAEASAVASDAHLVTINDQAENDFLVSQFGTERTFIGLKQDGEGAENEPSGGWRWRTGEQLSDEGAFVNWLGGQPDNYGPDNYAFFNWDTPGKWSDAPVGGWPPEQYNTFRGIIETDTPGSGEKRFFLPEVLAKANIFDAGLGSPTQGGVLPPSIDVTGLDGQEVTFPQIVGRFNMGADDHGPDGAHTPGRSVDLTSVGGISGYRNGNNTPALVGVFLGDTQPETAPATLDFSENQLGENFEVLAPVLGQVFFIGDGVTREGARQKFFVPAGAKKLYLGLPDGDNGVRYHGAPLGYGDNSGTVSVRAEATSGLEPRFLNARFPSSGTAFSLAGGTPPYAAVTVSAGSLPPGLTINDKTVQGRPTEEGIYSVTLRTEDSLNAEGMKTFTLNVTPAPDGMIAWWKGDTAGEDSAGDHDAVPSGNAAVAGGGLVGGGAFVFDGDDDLLSVPHDDALDLTGDFTIEAWVKLDSNTGQEPTLVAKRSADNREVSYVLFVEADGRLSLASRALDSQSRDWTETTTPAGVVLSADGLWKHLAVTGSGTTVKFYLNGELVHTGTHLPARPVTPEVLTIGGSSVDGGVVGEWNGSIDELSLYNRALTAAEIGLIAEAHSMGKIFRTKPAFTDEDFPFEGGQLAIKGGTAPFGVTVVAGELPEGLEISSTGLVSGTFANGPYNFTLRVTDSLGRSTERVFSGLRENPVEAPRDIVAWWPGDNTVADIIGGDHVAIPEDGSVGNGPGKVGRAFHFNGVDQSLETPQQTDVLNHLPLTIEAWVKPEAHASGSIGDPLPTNVISSDTPLLGGHGFGVHIYPNGSKLNVEMQGEDADFRTVPDVTFTSGQWYHIAVVYTEGNVKTYVNGVLKDSYDYTQGPIDNESIVRIGRHNDDAGYGTRRFFKGAIDEISVYHAALMPAEIAAIASAGAGGKARYDAAKQFVTTPAPQTPGSLWTYGALDAGEINTSTFALFTQSSFRGDKHFWDNGGLPEVGFNPSPTVSSINGAGGTEIRILPLQLSMHPSPYPFRPSVLRWTAPAAGRYAVCGSFNGADAHGTTTDIHVYFNGEPLIQTDGTPANGSIGFFIGINGLEYVHEFMGNGHSFTGIIIAEAGDTVDFIVGVGNGDFSFDSTGVFASVVPLGLALAQPSNLAIETQDPPEIERLWQFQTTYASAIPGASLRLQYAEAETPNEWHDLDVSEGSNTFTRESGSDVWTLHASLAVPAGNYRFRVIASAPGYPEATGAVFGQNALGGETDDPIAVSAPGEPPPPPAPLLMAASSKLVYKLGGKANATTARQGALGDFTITQPAPADAPEPQASIQWSTTPGDESSWQDLDYQTATVSGKGASRTIKITTTHLPAGEGIYFRVLTSGSARLPALGPVVKGALKLAGPITITSGPIWEYAWLTNTSNNTSDSSGDVVNEGENLIYSLEFRNEGSASATGVEVKLKAPAGTKLVDSTATDRASSTASLVTWKIPNLPPNEKVIKKITVQVTSKASKITFKRADASVKCLEIKTALNPDLFGYPNDGKTLNTVILSRLELYLSASTYNPRVGETVDFTLNASNKMTTPITDASVTFRVPDGMHVEYLRLPDSNGHFVDTQFPNPSPSSNPSLAAFEYGKRQLITWNLGTVPGNTTRVIRFTLRVMYDVDPVVYSRGVSIATALSADDYNFFAKDGTKKVQAFATIPSVQFTLSPDPLPGTRASNLQLVKSAAADGATGGSLTPAEPLYELNLGGLGRVATPLKNTRITYKLAYTNALYPTSGGPPAAARNAVIHEEIPSGTTFLGFLQRNGVPLSANFVVFKNAKGQVIPSGGDITQTRYMDIAVGSLAAGEGGVITYDVLATASEGTAIASRAQGAIIPKSSGVVFEGYSIWCENRRVGGRSTPENLISWIQAGDASFEQPFLWVSNPYPEPGETVDIEISYAVKGPLGVPLQNVAVNFIAPKELTVNLDPDHTGQVDITAPLGADLRPLRAYLSGESHSLVRGKTTNDLTFSLSNLPGGRKGVLAASVTLPSPLPASFLTPEGGVKPLVLRAQILGQRPATPKAVNLTPYSQIAVLNPRKNAGGASAKVAKAAKSANSAAEMTKMFVGRTSPLSVARGQQFDMQVFFGNIGNEPLFQPVLTMVVPQGLTLVSNSSLFYYTKGFEDGTFDGLGYSDISTKIRKVEKQNVFTIEGLALQSNTLAAVRLTFRVDDNYAYDTIEDVSLSVNAPNASGVTAPRMVIDVRKEQSDLAFPSYANKYLSSLSNDAPEAARNAFLAPSAEFTVKSRQIGISGADFLQLTNGVVVIPLGSGRSAVIGPPNLVAAAQGNILSDDGAARIAAAHESVAGFKISGVKRNNFAPQAFRVDDIIKGVVLNTGVNLVAAGGGNLVAAGGGNLVAAGGGNLINNSTGALARAVGFTNSNLVAAGGGNLVAAGGGNLVAAGGGNMVAAGGLNMVAAGGLNLVAAGGGNLVAAGGGNLVAAGAGNLVAAGGGNFSAHQISSWLVGLKDSASMIGLDGGTLVAAGAGNFTGISKSAGMGVISHNGGAVISHNGSLFTPP